MTNSANIQKMNDTYLTILNSYGDIVELNYQFDVPSIIDELKSIDKWMDGSNNKKGLTLTGSVDDLEFDAQKTYALNFTYSDIHITDRSNLCTVNADVQYWIDVGSYEEGDCVFHEGQMWYATGSASYQNDGLEPNSWNYDDNDEEFLNANPWIPVYPWGAATKINIETQKTKNIALYALIGAVASTNLAL